MEAYTLNYGSSIADIEICLSIHYTVGQILFHSVKEQCQL